MVPKIGTLEDERSIKQVLLRFARIKSLGAGISGTVFVVVIPFLAAMAHNADAPFAPEIAVSFFVIGIGCLVLAWSANREVSLLQEDSQGVNIPVIFQSLGNGPNDMPSSAIEKTPIRDKTLSPVM